MSTAKTPFQVGVEDANAIQEKYADLLAATNATFTVTVDNAPADKIAEYNRGLHSVLGDKVQAIAGETTE